LCGHTNIAVLSAMSNRQIRFVMVRHEQIAAHAADGYARVTGKASVVLSHLGPGLTNAATGVANAALDCIPMVVIAGDVPSYYYGKHPHQEVNLHADGSQFEIYRPFVKRAWRVDTAELFPEIVEKAFALAESGQPGPVLVNVPMDIFSKEIDVELFQRLRHNTKTLTPPSMDEETAEKIVRVLGEASAPVIYAGGGVILAKAADELKAFVDHMQIPVAHSLMGKGVLPDDNPFVLGMTGFWGTQFTNDTCLAADWVLGLGTRFKEADCSSWYRDFTFNIPSTKLIHIDIEPQEIGRNFPTEVGVVADLKQSLKAMLKAAKKLFPNGRERRRPAIPDLHARLGADARRLCDDGFWPARRSRRQDRGSRSRGHLDGRRRRLRSEPGDACNGPRNEPGRHLGGDEQQRVWHHRRPAESALRAHGRHHVREGHRPER
jgi:acetolactate synthase-1/2/3 large subunit